MFIKTPQTYKFLTEDLNWGNSSNTDFMLVGDENNPAYTGLSFIAGSVSNKFFISKYELTNNEYYTYCNNVDPDGTNNYLIYLDNTLSSSNGEILFDDSKPKYYKYSVKNDNFKNKPVRFISPIMSAAYCNWLHNGAKKYTTSNEAKPYILNGSYDLTSVDLLGIDKWYTLSLVESNNAIFKIPKLDEWVKSAFYSGSGYYIYSTQSNQEPYCIPDVNSSGDGIFNTTNTNITITQQPKNIRLNSQDSYITISGLASGTSLSYQWQYAIDQVSSEPTRWQNISGATSPVLDNVKYNQIDTLDKEGLQQYSFTKKKDYIVKDKRLRLKITASNSVPVYSDTIRVVCPAAAYNPVENYGSVFSYWHYVTQNLSLIGSESIAGLSYTVFSKNIIDGNIPVNLNFRLYSLNLGSPSLGIDSIVSDSSWYTGNDSLITLEYSTDGSSNWVELYREEHRGLIQTLDAYTLQLEPPSSPEKRYYRIRISDMWPYSVNNNTSSALASGNFYYYDSNDPSSYLSSTYGIDTKPLAIDWI